MRSVILSGSFALADRIMSNMLSPKFGRLQFSGIAELSDRIREVESFFGEEARFSIYGVNEARQTFYGLSADDLVSEEHAGLISFTATCSNESGNSINLAISRSNDTVSGRYVITASSSAGQKELSARLMGTWVPASPEEISKKRRLAELIFTIKQHSKRRERIERQPAIIPLPPRETEPAQPTRPDLSIDKFPLLYDTFPFDEKLSSDVFSHLMQQLRTHFFHEQDFYFRTVNRQGEPLGDIGIMGVKDQLDQHRGNLKRIYVEVHTDRHEWMTLQLEFDSSNEDHRTELEISSRRNKQIQATVRDTLEKSLNPALEKAGMIHEMFSFDPGEFQLDQVAKLLKTLTSKFLGQEIVTAFLSTHQGETYSGLRLKTLRQIYQQHEGDVSFLLFGVNQAESGHTFSLMFQFGGMGQSPHGSLSMMWGHHATHQAIRAVVFQELALRTYRPDTTTSQPPQLSRREMRVNPTFFNRDFRPEPLNALVLMQPDAYWSDSIWELLNHQLTRSGYSSSKGKAIFEPDARESVWTQLNEVDLLIADLTYKHPSVYYYLGIAHTLGIKTIQISQLDRDIPDDFKTLHTIIYDNNLEGIRHLQEEVEKLVRKR